MSPDVLTPEERNIYIEWLEKKTRASISPALSAKMYELFLRGDSCERIAHLSQGIQVGQILEARIRDKWDERRDKYIDELYGTIASRLRQTQLEAVEFTTDLMAAAHKEYGTKLKKYLMSGDPADLPPNAIASLATYAKVADTLLKLSGQNKEKSSISIVNPAPGANPDAGGPTKAIEAGTLSVDSQSANKILKFLEAQEPDE